MAIRIDSRLEPFWDDFLLDSAKTTAELRNFSPVKREKVMDLGEPWEGDGCDYFIMETGHHAVEDVCKYALSHSVKALRFNHHGREIIGDRGAAEKLVSDYSTKGAISIKIAHDLMREDI